LEADVNNGGFDQYYFNSSGNTAFAAAHALKKIGAPLMAEIVAQANSIFPNNSPPRDRYSRQEILEGLRTQHEEFLESLNARFFEYPEDLSALLFDYVKGLIPRTSGELRSSWQLTEWTELDIGTGHFYL
jgi:hypothetical protein